MSGTADYKKLEEQSRTTPSTANFRQLDEQSAAKTIIIAPQIGYISNALVSIEDGQSIDFQRMRNTVKLPGNLQIGDVEFVVPPQSISVQTEAKNQSMRTLRSKGSTKIKSGYSDVTIEISLYFHSKESINGYQIEGLDKSDWYINGLRPLISQFKQAPFVPIINDDLNRIHGIFAVTLKSLTAQIVPGFPDCILVNLTLLKFEHTAFLSFTPNFYNAVNWPLFRWYTQRQMSNYNKEHTNLTYLAPYEDDGNTIIFEIINEDYLQKVQNEVGKIKKELKPSEYREKTRDTSTTSGKIVKDYDSLALGIKQRTKATMVQYKDNFVMDGEEHIYRPQYGETDDNKNYYYISLASEENIAVAKAEGLKKELGIIGPWLIPPKSKTVKAIQDNYAKVEEKWNQYDESYNQKVDMLTGLVDKEDFDTIEIPDLYIQSAMIALDNVVSTFQVQQQECPAHQFLGAGDTFIQLSIRTQNEESLKLLVDTIKDSERLVRNYRNGIVSGFLGIKNSFVQLFGVRYVMVNTLTIDTVLGSPDLYEVTMVLVGFNKNQRDSEKLKIINNAANFTSMNDIANSYGTENLAVEQKLLTLELYPDLELPTFKELEDFCDIASILYPYAGVKEHISELTNTIVPLGTYVDPDFYMHTPNTFRDLLQKQIEQKDQEAKEGKDGVYLTDMYTPSGDKGATIRFPNANDSMESWFAFEMSDSLHDIYKSIEDDAQAARKKVDEQMKSQQTSSAGDNEAYQPITTQISATGSSASDASDAGLRNKIATNLQNPGTVGGKYKNIRVMGGNHDVTCPYNKQGSTWTGGRHTGVDFSASTGEAVYMPFAGKVVEVANDGGKGYGIHVVVKCTSGAFLGYSFLFGHLSGTNAKLGQKVKANSVIGYAGNTGNSRGVHLHFEVRSDSGKDVNPLPFLNLNLKTTDANSAAAEEVAEQEKDAKFKQRLQRVIDGTKDYGNISRDVIIKFGIEALNLFQEYSNYICPSVVIAQAIQETRCVGITGHPKKQIDGADHNYFGIKYFDGMSGNYCRSEDERMWRAYSTFEAGLRGYADTLSAGGNSSYKKAGILKAPTYVEVAKAIQQGGWCGSSTEYADKLITIIENGGFKAWDTLINRQSGTFADGLVSFVETLIGYDEGRISISSSEQEEIDYRISTNNANMELNKIWKESFQDAVETDQRGRLLRAFPTFQMLLVDEGKWISWVKMWDNFYGFNAIESIDVVKSRKIAADTCLISMSNIYKNLTDMDINSDRENQYSQGYKWHDLLFNNFDNTSLIEARKERIETLMLQTGARLHLRMGYGSNAANLPVVFNGTITELEFGEDTINLVAQGDGIELCNAISGNPKELNDGVMNFEARQTLCYALCEYNSVIKQFIQKQMTDPNGHNPIWELIFNAPTSPNGVTHFGNPVHFPNNIEIQYFWQDIKENGDVGDAALNIYTAAGTGSRSEWVYAEGDYDSSKMAGQSMGWNKLWGIIPWAAGDQPTIKLSLYNKSIWDIAQTLALTAPDYISTILPFEFRSTLFYGKPYWPYFYRYIYKYDWHPDKALWERSSATKTPLSKPMSQTHIYMSKSDIILNKIKASEEGVVTNVIATFKDGVTSNAVCADSDIYPEKQKTAIENFDIEPPDKQVQDSMAAQALRNYMQDMYKGNLVVIGDPSAKPYDHMYINDVPNQMFGLTGVKQVIQHMNADNGFTTDLCPDAIVIVDDSLYMNYISLLNAVCLSSVGSIMAYAGKVLFWNSIKSKLLQAYGKARPAGTALKNMTQDSIKKWAGLDNVAAGADEAKDTEKLIEILKKSDKASAQEVVKTLENIQEKTKDFRKAKAVTQTMKLGRFLVSGTGIGLIAQIGFVIIAHSALEAYSRFIDNRQAVMIYPLQYKGYPFTAGINGHQGCVIGDTPSRMDKFWSGDANGVTDIAIDILNFLSEEEE